MIKNVKNIQHRILSEKFGSTLRKSTFEYKKEEMGKVISSNREAYDRGNGAKPCLLIQSGNKNLYSNSSFRLPTYNHGQ